MEESIMKKILILILVMVLVMALGTSTAYAAAETFTVTGGGRTFSMEGVVGDQAVTTFTPDPDGTNTIALGSDLVFTGGETVLIEDESGTNAGWIFQFTATNFYCESSIDDPVSNVATNYLDVYIPAAAWLSFTIDNDGNIVDVIGDITGATFSSTTDVTGVGADIANTAATTDKWTAGLATSLSPSDANTSTVTNTIDINILEIEPGYGAGGYDFDFDPVVTIDEWLPTGTHIATDTGSGRFHLINTDGNINDGAAEKIQVFAGVYTSTFGYSLSSNATS
jgi:hypothetical protein